MHAATKNLDQGLYPNAFCKIYPDVLCGDDDWVNVMHADGAGTKEYWPIYTGKKLVMFLFGKELHRMPL